MTMNEAKKDAIARLKRAGIEVLKIEGKTISFSDLARARPIFLKITLRGQVQGNLVRQVCFDDLPKPSQGGYIINMISGEPACST